MTIRVSPWALGALLAWAAAPLGAAEIIPDLRSPAASEARLKKDIFTLASDKMEGRGVTTKGNALAADYIAAEFKKAGLTPAGPDGSYFQPFGINGTALEKPARLVLYGPQGQQVVLKQGVHFEPMGLSSAGRLVAAPVVFAGYGITAKDPDLDEYAGLDAANKVVVVLRDTPRADNKFAVGANWRRRHGSFTEKMKNADAHKASAILFVNDRDTAADGDDLLTFGYTAPFPTPYKLPALHVRRAVAEKLLGTSLESLERDIDRDLKPRSQPIADWTVSLEVDVTRGPGAIPAKNVVGVLEGSGKLADETVVLGAHYDHVGYGGPYSLATLKKMVLHPGADDNGSGTTAILELARRLAQEPKQGDRRRLVFMTFSGEELGLFGSDYYCKHPLFPLDKTAAMINLDMVGRLAKDPKTNKDRLTVYGTGSATTFDALLDALNKKYDFQIKKIPSGIGPSDQMTFYLKKVPVFFLFTNDHPDYHRPGDTPDKINVPGMRRVIDLTEEMAAHLASVPERPEYLLVKGPAMAGGPSGPRLGIRPDYGDAGDGVLLGGVNEGEAAAKAGLKEGDRLVEIGGKSVKSLENYMVLMRGYKKGDTLDVTILRAGVKQTVKVKLD